MNRVGIELRAVELAYGPIPAIRPLSGAFATGAITAVVGANGSGKSSLLKVLAGEIPPSGGEFRLNGAGPTAYLAQDGGVDRNFPIVLGDFVGLGFNGRRGLFAGLDRSDRSALAEALGRVGLSGLERRPIAALSGGQFQRALFARIMVQDAPTILLDEPFAALDAATAAELSVLVADWARGGRTVIMVLHDLAMARAVSAEALVLAEGRSIAWGPTAVVLTPINIERARLSAESLTL